MNKLSEKERIAALLNMCGGNKSELGRRMGMSPQSISSWLARGTYDAMLIAKSFGELSSEWILHGVGKMLKRDEGYEETEVVTDEVAEHQYATSKAPSTDMITIPRAVLDALTQQLDVKDAQIQHLMEQLSRISYGTDIQPIESR